MSVKRGPWTVKSSELKYKNPWTEVIEDQVIQPDGKPGIFGRVIIKPGVSIVALDDKGFVHLVEEYAYAINRYIIDTPCGGIDEGEPPLKAAKRELKEELGITAEEWIPLGFVDPFTNQIASPAHMFLARKLSFSEVNREGTETIKPVKVSLDAAVQMVLDSKITHAQGCVAILKAKDFLDKEKK